MLKEASCKRSCADTSRRIYSRRSTGFQRVFDFKYMDSLLHLLLKQPRSVWRFGMEEWKGAFEEESPEVRGGSKFGQSGVRCSVRRELRKTFAWAKG